MNKLTQLRSRVGELVHASHRALLRQFDGESYDLFVEDNRLPHVVIEHRTPLFRDLPGVSRELDQNKLYNLQLAAKQINGLCIPIGRSFSFWHHVGRPSAKRGYRNGLILRRGVIGEGIGGGLCQMTNLLYWMAIHSPLAVTERWRHSYDVFPDTRRIQPFGSGATCSYPNIDLVFKNLSQNVFQIVVEVSDTHLCGAILSQDEIKERYEVYESSHNIEHQIDGSYRRKNTLHRKVIDDDSGDLIRTELVTSNDALMMYQPLIESYGA